MSSAAPAMFASALRAYGLGRCSRSGNTIWIGLGPQPEYRREPLEDMPSEPRSLCFVEAPEQADLVAAFAANPEAATVQHLMIGTSHDYARSRPIGYDMSAAIAALGNGQFPALQRLSLGDMELLFNGHRYFGTLGDPARILAAAPALRELKLHGHFMLHRPLKHDRLEELTVWVDEIGVSGGPLSQPTVTHLLSSDFPRLHTFDADLDDGGREHDYAIPDTFFAGGELPALRSFTINCLAPDAESRLAAWKSARGVS